MNIKEQLLQIDMSIDLRSIITIHSQLYKDIKQETLYLGKASLRQRVWHILNDIKEAPLCLHCKKTHTTWNDKIKIPEYRTYCSKNCANKNKQRLNNVKKTNLERYGVENVFQSNDIKTQSKKTNLERYGVENPSQSSTIKKKKKKASQEKYGTDCVLQSPQIKEKIKQTNLERYGVSHTSQKDIPTDIYDKLNNKTWLHDQYINKNKTIPELAKILNISHSTVYLYLKRHNFYDPNNVSISEKQISKICCDIIDIKSNTRKIIPPYELDIFIPEKNLAIEYNGLYWHSELCGKDKSYHIKKTILCEEKGIRLIHIFEHEWLLKRDIVTSRIKSLLNNTTKIYARHCIIQPISKTLTKEFLVNNHIQGYIGCKYSYGLYYNNKLVSIMTFGCSRFNKKYEYELLRFCSILNHTVVGGASKLFKHFIKTHSPRSIISYCDLRYGTGKVYEHVGFTKIHTTPPNYWYFHNNSSLKVYSRIKFQKHKLYKSLEYFDETLTEWENMQNNGWNRIWDCGNSVWAFNL